MHLKISIPIIDDWDGRTELEITAGHWPFSEEFSIMAEQKWHMTISKNTGHEMANQNGQDLHIDQPNLNLISNPAESAALLC